MGDTLELWRARIGCFVQPVKTRSRIQTLSVSAFSVSLAIRLTLFLLLVVHGVESNPGPGSSINGAAADSGDTRGRGTGRGRGRGARGGMGRGFQNVEAEDFFADTSTSGSSRRVTRSLQSQLQSSQQPSIANWLSSQPHPQSQAGQQSRQPSSERSRDDSESDTDDLAQTGLGDGSLGNGMPMNILLDIQRSVSRLDKKFDNIQKSVSDLKKDNKKLKQQNEQLRKQVGELSTTVSELECLSKQNEIRYEKLEGYTRRENLRFFDIPETPKETWDQSEERVRGYITETLGIDDSSIKIERAHRLPSKSSPRPLIVRFSFFKDKDRVLKRYREIRKSQPTNADGADDQLAGVRISEDFPERVRKVRALLVKFLNQALQAGKDAYLRYDKLIVNGYAYEYDYVKERPVSVSNIK